MEYLGGRDGMYVLTLQESVDHDGVMAEVGHQPQFYLRIVSAQEQASFIGNEGASYLAAQCLAYRYVLQVRRR